MFNVVVYTFNKQHLHFPISRSEYCLSCYEISEFFNNKLISLSYLGNSIIIKKWEY